MCILDHDWPQNSFELRLNTDTTSWLQAISAQSGDHYRYMTLLSTTAEWKESTCPSPPYQWYDITNKTQRNHNKTQKWKFCLLSLIQRWNCMLGLHRWRKCKFPTRGVARWPKWYEPYGMESISYGAQLRRYYHKHRVQLVSPSKGVRMAITVL